MYNIYVIFILICMHIHVWVETVITKKNDIILFVNILSEYASSPIGPTHMKTGRLILYYLHYFMFST